MQLHDRALVEHGGASGVRDEGLLESAIAAARNTHLYGAGDVFDVAAAYAFHIAQAQAFIDGNKRAAMATALTFLHLNGVEDLPSDECLYRAMIEVAEHTCDKRQLAALFREADGRPSGLSETPLGSDDSVNARRLTKRDPASGPIDLSTLSVPQGLTGVLPVTVMSPSVIGFEVVLVWMVPDDIAAELKSVRNLGLSLNTGIFGSRSGLLMWMAFSATEGTDAEAVRYASESLVAPDQPRATEVLRDLSRQTHWHVEIRDTHGNSIRQLEFENHYDLEASLHLFAELSASVPPFDFAELKRDFQRLNPITALIATPVAA